MTETSVQKLLIAGHAGTTPWKLAVRIAADSNVTTSGLQTIQSVALQDGDRVLLTNQSRAWLNGAFVARSGTWDKAPDMDRSARVQLRSMIPVSEGTYAGHIFELSSPTSGPIILGSTDLTFTDRGKIGDKAYAPDPFIDNATITQSGWYRYNISTGKALTIPAANTMPGEAICILEVGGNTNAYTVTPPSGSINGGSSIDLATANQLTTLLAFSDNTWRSAPYIAP